MSAWREGWRLALGTLTVLPSGPVTISPAAAGAMVALAPVAVLPLAGAAAALTWLGGRHAPDPVTGLLVVGWLAVATRAMHLDGVADVADGIGGGWTPERARQILHSGDTGPMGVVALILVLGLQAAAVGALADRAYGWILVGVAVATSRWWLSLACRSGLPAMPGSQLGAVIANSLPAWQAIGWVSAGTLVVGLTAAAAGWPWWHGVGAALAATVLVFGLLRRSVRAFGGVNGDVMGSVIEAALTSLLVVLACR